MTPLNGKKLLVVGDESLQILELEKRLKRLGMSITLSDCQSVSPSYINDNKVDLILLNHLHSDAVCTNMITVSHNSEVQNAIPVFALVKKNSHDIQEALTHGAADYITPEETIDSIIQKIEAVFVDDNVFASSSSIDITPVETKTKVKGIKVFVVEDDSLLRNLLSIRLGKSSFPHEFSNDGKNAIEDIARFKPDAIILDLMLPGVSGFDVLAKLKADPKLKDIPVIVFSNRDGMQDKQKAIDLGASCFYVKAMTDLSEIIEKIEELVNKK